MRYFIELSYNGKAYHGWQNQPNAISVQEVIEKALSTLLQQKTDIVGAGRTDAGVHASQMFAHFDSEIELNTQDLTYKLNSFLPKDVAIHNMFLVTNDAHARLMLLREHIITRFPIVKMCLLLIMLTCYNFRWM